MDFFLVIMEWLDFSFSGLGVIFLVQVYRRRALVTDTIWWTRENKKQRWLFDLIAWTEDRGVSDPAQFILDNGDHGLYHLTADQKMFLRHYQAVHTMNTMDKGEDGGGGTVWNTKS